MENTNTSLRQSDNVLQVEGILSEKNLVKELSKKDPRITAIKGTMTFKIDDTNFITVRVYEQNYHADKTTGELKANTAYEGLSTVMDTYKSISDVGEEAATKVRFRRGSISPRTYIDPQSKDRKTTIDYKNRYFSQATGTFEPQATFSVEGFINKVREEMVGNDITGRLIVELLVSDYAGGVEPLTIYVEKDLADAFASTYAVGETLTVYGEIVSKAVVANNKIGVAFGVSKNKTGPSRRTELVLTGASAAYDDDKAFDPATVKAALVERETRLEKEAETAQQAVQSGRVRAESTPTSPVRRAPMGW